MSICMSVCIYRCIRESAQELGSSVTFMAKPIHNDVGSGCHVHINLDLAPDIINKHYPKPSNTSSNEHGDKATIHRVMKTKNAFCMSNDDVIRQVLASRSM